MKNLLKETISLYGKWHFKLDKDNIGEKEEWYNKDLEDFINLPGTLQQQGFGDKITKDTPLIHALHDRLWFLREYYKEFANQQNTEIPFLSQPCRHYTGAAWYQKEIEIPEKWEDKYIVLNLELVRWKTSVWVDNTYCGSFDSLCVPHKYELGKLKAGKHILTVKADNSMIFPYRPDAHGVSDSVGHTWNGIAGKIELIAVNGTALENISVYPDYLDKSVLVKITIKNYDKISKKCLLKIKKSININYLEKTESEEAEFNINVNNQFKVFEYNLKLSENAMTWDEFAPVLHKLDISLIAEDNINVLDSKTVNFGLRNIAVSGRKFILNGKAISFRGTHDAGCFPLTGYPSTDVNEWKKIMSVCKEWGLNHIRYHSWCPPEAAFIAADELGMYLQIETGMWNYFVKGGEIEKQLYIETDRILDEYGNHPSFLLLSSGNEPHGDYKPIVKEWVAKYRRTDNRHLYCAQSGWLWPIPPEKLDVTDYFYTCSRYGTSKMRGTEGWFGKDYSKYIEDLEAPFISHELGQYCVYPDFSQIDKFTGYLQASNYKVYKKLAENHKILYKNKDFVKSSAILHLAAYKEEIEANLRTYGFSGFSLLDLHDYLGQGGALIGFLDAFWDRKPFAEPKLFTRFCSHTVPLARIEKLVYKSNEWLEADVEVACYYKEDFTNVNVYWKIADECGAVYQSGIFENMNIKSGQNTFIGKIKTELSSLKTPLMYKLIVGIENTEIENDWKIWIYPKENDFSRFSDIKVVQELEEAIKLLKEGSKVLFLPKTEDISYNSPALSWLPVFWNGHMGPKWSRGLGLWCNEKHSALSDFPTSCAMEWQWREIVENARGMNIEALPEETEPFIWPIDDWNRSYKLALAFEAKVYAGKLIVCSADLKNNLEFRPAARQLLYSIMKYMQSENFNPAVNITQEHLKSFLFDTLIMKKLGSRVSITEGMKEEENGKNPISNIISGDPNTYWLAGGKYGGKYPFEIEIEINSPAYVKGMYVMPRQNHRDLEGAVRKYEIYSSLNGKEWEKICEGEFLASFDLQRIDFPKSIRLKMLRLRLIDGFAADNIYYWVREEKKGFYMKHGTYSDEYVSLAEVMFICDEFENNENFKDMKVVYKDVATDSEEIY